MKKGCVRFIRFRVGLLLFAGMMPGMIFQCAGAESPGDIIPELTSPERSLDTATPFAVNGLFTDGMVLQRDMPVPVWGWGPQGGTVTVEFGGQRKTAVVDSSNHWKVILDPMPASSTPRKMTISSNHQSAIGNRQFADVLVGDVWLCSGQSNMQVEMKLDAKRYPRRAADIAASNNPMIRFFKIDRASSRFPRRDIPPVQDNIYEPWANSFLNNQWRPCTTDWVPHVSATAFYFAQQIQPQLGCPVGLLVSARGGTAIDKWVSRDVINGRDCWSASRQKLWKTSDEWKAFIAPPAEVRREFTEKYPSLKSLWLAQKDGSSDREPRPPVWPTCFYNGMLHPLAPLALKGVLWYQGETDTGNPVPYEDKLTDLITSWRALWSRDNLPFIVAQLAGFDRFGGKGAELRNEQAQVAKQVSGVYLATLIDAGMHQRIHPYQKEVTGERLSRVALNEVYRRPVAAYGPQLTSVEKKDKGLLLTLTHVGTGVVAKEVNLDGTHLSAGVLKGFSVAGMSGQFVAAEAKITAKNQIFVSAADVEDPAVVRYAWADFPEANLYNTDGLPAAPFQSGVTEK